MFKNPKQRWKLRMDKYILLLILGWTVIVIVSLFWNSRVTHLNYIEKTRIVARSFYDLTIQFREAGAREQKALLLSHVLFWFIGTGGIMLFSRNIQRHQVKLIETV